MSDPFAPARPMITLPARSPLEGRRPRLLGHVLRYMPSHAAGAERMLHGLLRGLQDRGWDVAVVAVEHRGSPYEWEGVPVQTLTDAQMIDPYSWCDVAITHLDVTSHAMAWARYGRPLVHICHNHRQLSHHRVPNDGSQYAIWNSEWIEREYRNAGWVGEGIVVRPPLMVAEHETVNRRRHGARTVTLVNLLGEKGGPLFWRLARRCPDWTFLGVLGAYGFQAIPDPMPANGLVVPNGPDMSSVWERTTVYLAPSWYESYSLSSAEALCSGIPVLAHPTPGLRESMDEAAQFIDRDDDDAWVDAIRSLEDRRTYQQWSKRARERAAVLDAQTGTDLDALDLFVRGIIGV